MVCASHSAGRPRLLRAVATLMSAPNAKSAFDVSRRGIGGDPYKAQCDFTGSRVAFRITNRIVLQTTGERSDGYAGRPEKQDRLITSKLSTSLNMIPFLPTELSVMVIPPMVTGPLT